MNDDIHAFPHTGTAYRSTIYTPFTLSVPSEIGMSGGGSAGEGEGGNAAPQGAPHRAPVVFEEEGWTESADGLQSTKNNPLTATTPVGEPWVMLLLAIAYIFLRGKRLRTAAMVLLIAAIPAAATTVSLTIQNSAVRAGEKVIVAPTVTSAPEGKSFLCWELCHDEACAYPVEEVIEAVNELVKEGLVHHVGMTECTAEELRRGNEVCPIKYFEKEYSPKSLWRLECPTKVFFLSVSPDEVVWLA